LFYLKRGRKALKSIIMLKEDDADDDDERRAH
jgi:hypothetical protein